MTTALPGQSQSKTHPGYWWYRAREDLLAAALGEYVGQPAHVLDVGSADGPSVGWLARHRPLTMDLDADALSPGGVCGSVLRLPFRDGAFDLVTAFDVVEHCEPEATALAELARVLAPGGRLLLSVPAYQWAWTGHDVRAGHHRRYTRPRIVRAVEGAGLRVDRATYAFASVFPLFAGERLSRRLRERRRSTPPPAGLPQLPGRTDELLVRACRSESRVLRRRDLPFGSSVFVAATRI